MLQTWYTQPVLFQRSARELGIKFLVVPVLVFARERAVVASTEIEERIAHGVVLTIIGGITQIPLEQVLPFQDCGPNLVGDNIHEASVYLVGCPVIVQIIFAQSRNVCITTVVIRALIQESEVL